METSETNLQFQSRTGVKLKAVLHLPVGPGPYPWVLCFHGLTLNMGQFTVLGRRLAEAGIGLLRYDACGHGSSEGSLESITVASLVEDGLEVVRQAAHQSGLDAARFALLGFSLGGCVASLLATRPEFEKPSCLALWAPLLNSEEWARRRLAEFKQLEGGRVEVWGGKVVREEMFTQAPSLDCFGRAEAFPGPLFLAHPFHDRNMPIEYSQTIAWRRQAKGLPTWTYWAPQSAHLFEVPQERETLFQGTVGFFKQQFLSL